MAAANTQYSLDGGLQLLHVSLVLGPLHRHRHLHRLLVQRRVVQRLGVVHLVLLLPQYLLSLITDGALSNTSPRLGGGGRAARSS